MTRMSEALPSVAPDSLGTPAPHAFSPETDPESLRPPLGFADANAYLSEFGLEAYTDLVESLRLARPGQYALVKAIEASFAQAAEAVDQANIAELEGLAQAKKAELMQGSFACVVDLVTEIQRAGSSVAPEQLITEANRLASGWFDKIYAAARIRRAPVYPDDVLCVDYLKPKLLSYKPKQSRPASTKDMVNPVATQAVLSETEDGQLYAPGLLGKYRRPPVQQFGHAIIEVARSTATNGQLAFEYPSADQEPLPVVNEIDSGINDEAISEELPDTTMPSEESPSDPDMVPTDDNDVPIDEIDPEMMLDILGDMEEFGTDADLADPQDPGDLEDYGDESDDMDSGTSPTGRKRGNREKDSLIIESVHEEYGYDYILARGTDLERLVARYVMEEDTTIEAIDITNEMSFEEIVKALRKCLHMREYIASDDLAVRGRFAHVSERAQGAGKGRSNKEKFAQKKERKRKKAIKTDQTASEEKAS